MHIDEKQLKDFILDSNLVNKKGLEESEKKAKKDGTTFDQVLVKDGVITDDDLRRMQAYLLGIPFVSLKDQQIDHKILAMIPEPIARNHNIVAFRQLPEALEVAMLDTADLTAIDFIKKNIAFFKPGKRK